MRMWVVWAVGVLAYASAVLQRTSFGVAGMDAAERFGAPAGVVATFVVLQLVVYAVMQVPVGVLLDRYGARALIAVGAVVMTLGQLLMAMADSVPEGMAARVLVGAGDAMTFGSVVRLVPTWFAPRRVPLITQLTGLLGQSGQIASALPLAWSLRRFGWTPSFLGAAAAALVVMVLALALVRDHPPGTPPTRIDIDPRTAARLVLDTWQAPGTRLGVWTHYVTCFPPVAFAMMWGVPFLVAGEGRTPGEASGLLALHVLASLPCGPLLGALTQRYPFRRSNLVLAVVAANALPLVAVLLWPGPAPMWLLAVLALGLATGGPGSAIGFDFARTFNPVHRLGTATGLVIMGGFVGGLVAILLVGVVVDVAVASGISSHTAFRLAMAVQIPMLAVGVWGLLSGRRTVRAAEGIDLDPVHHALQRRWRRRRGR